MLQTASSNSKGISKQTNKQSPSCSTKDKVLAQSPHMLVGDKKEAHQWQRQFAKAKKKDDNNNNNNKETNKQAPYKLLEMENLAIHTCGTFILFSLLLLLRLVLPRKNPCQICLLLLLFFLLFLPTHALGEERREKREEERGFKTCNFGKVFRPLFTLIPDTRCESFHRRHRTCLASWSIAELFDNTQSAEKQLVPTTPMRFNSSSYVLLPRPSPTIYSPFSRLLLQRPPPSSSFPCEDFFFFFFSFSYLSVAWVLWVM